jgi:type IV secretory pathway VirB10-like protein
MGAISKSLLVAVAAILGLCAVAGFTMGLTSTFAHRGSAANDEEAPIAGNIAPGVTIKDAQPLAPPPPPAPPKPKVAATDAAAASDQPPADAPAAKAPAAPPTESAPGAPPGLAIPPLPKAPAPAPLPADLPPV